MTTEELVTRVSASRLFQGADKDVLHKVLSGNACRLCSFSANAVIYPLANESTPCLGILLSGKAEVTTPDAGHHVLLRFLEPGDLFGIANLFSKEPFVSVIRAERSTDCLFLSESAVAQLLDTDRGFREAYIGVLSDRIRFLNRKIGYLTAGSAERRLAIYLAGLGQGEVTLTDSISSLSDLLNLGRASLYRAFDRLETDGWLVKHGKRLQLQDPTAMLLFYKQ